MKGEEKGRLTKMIKNAKIYNRKSVLKEKERGREWKTHQKENGESQREKRKPEREKRVKEGGES